VTEDREGDARCASPVTPAGALLYRRRSKPSRNWVRSYKQQTSEPTLQNSAPGLTLGLYRDWGYGISTGVTARIARTTYDEVQPLFGELREDDLNSVTASVTKRDWALFYLVPTLSVTYIRNHSSSPFYS
jgi:Surface lipoprotein assembly modifier